MIINIGNISIKSLDELIIAEAYLGLLIEQTEANGRDIPSVLSEGLKAVEVELGSRLRLEKERKLTNLRIRAEQLKPIDQKRKDIDAEISALEDDLNIKRPTARRKR